jgi:hypothetical protein
MKKNVRVCHLTSVHKHTDIRIFHKECKSLAEAGYNVTIIAPGTIEQTIDGVTLKSVKSFSNRFLRMLFTTYLVYRKGLEENASIYHFHDPELMPWGYLLKIKGKKVIFDVHEDVAMQIYGKYWINRYLKSIVILIYNILEKYFASNFNYLITVTETISHKLKKINNNVIVVNNYPLSYEYENETYSWHKKENSVIYMGGITEIRGAKQMLEAINLCPNVNVT